MRRIARILLNTLRTLSFKKILKLLRLAMPHPLFSLLGFYATVKSFMLAQKHFPETNANNGIGNAYRHALWTCLIMMYCCKISSPQKALNFCKKACRKVALFQSLGDSSPSCANAFSAASSSAERLSVPEVAVRRRKARNSPAPAMSSKRGGSPQSRRPTPWARGRSSTNSP